MRIQLKWSSIDKLLLTVFLLLVIFGLMTVYSSSFKTEKDTILNFSSVAGKQFSWVIISITVGIIILLMEGQFINNMSYVFYAFIVLLLIGVLFMPSIKGAKSWFQIGSASIQPSEFAKLACSLAIAKYLGSVNVKIQDFKTKLYVILLLVFPAFLILMQPDPGTMLVFIAFIFVMYREGLSGNVLLFGFFASIILVIGIFLKASDSSINIFSIDFSGNYIFSIVLLFLGGLIFLIIKLFVLPRYRKSKYIGVIWATIIAIIITLGVSYVYDNLFKDRHRDRFQIMFGIKEDRKGVGYNIYQALAAIGSGETNGKGYLKGTLSNNRYKHVPEQNTDFIFCSYAEEWGYLGNLIFIALYITLLVRIIIIAERQRSKFTRIFGYCVASIFFFHFMINIAMVIGLAPVIGIPLPLFSKGGSSILTFTVMIFIFLRLDAERKEILR